VEQLIGFGLAVGAGYGVFLLYTAVVYGWRGIGPGPTPIVAQRRHRTADWLVQAGLADVRVPDLAAAMAVLALVVACVAWAIFGGVVAPLMAGLFAATFPVAAARQRRRQRRLAARDAWPRMIEEIRLRATTLGRSIPQALFDVGMSGPEELRPAFEAARREWLLTFDFPQTITVLKAQLADPTADSVCETLLIAHEIGGTDIDQRLEALIEDRIADLQGRKDTVSKQAGARFARWFVLVVPVGMALVGLTIGNGRAAYAEPRGQIGVVIGLSLIAVCWVWAGQFMKLPEERRVFVDREEAVG
jgi:tight adherence protein B